MPDQEDTPAMIPPRFELYQIAYNERTRALVQAVEGSGARIVCTRKTTPGLRALEKEAVRLGGPSRLQAEAQQGPGCHGRGQRQAEEAEDDDGPAAAVAVGHGRIFRSLEAGTGLGEADGTPTTSRPQARFRHGVHERG